MLRTRPTKSTKKKQARVSCVNRKYYLVGSHSIALMMKLNELSPSLRSRILSITSPLSTSMNRKYAALEVLTIYLSILDETLNCNSSGIVLYCLQAFSWLGTNSHLLLEPDPGIQHQKVILLSWTSSFCLRSRTIYIVYDSFWLSLTNFLMSWFCIVNEYTRCALYLIKKQSLNKCLLFSTSQMRSFC